MTHPDLITPLIVAAGAFATGAFAGWLFARQGRAPLESAVRRLDVQAKDALASLSQSQQQVSGLRVEIARLEERNEAEKRAFEEMRVALPDTFRALASQVLQEKSRQFAEQNRSSLDQMLEPLKTRLEDFQTKIQDVHLEQVRGTATLREQVTMLVASTTKVGDEANSLANALKGSNKAQGIWGEVVLERILESAGLRQGHEYESQESYSAGNGRRLQPDVVIHLPGERHLIIDSKVSLIDYEAHSKAATDAERAAALSEHLKSVRAHIRGLAEKNYQELYGLKSLDFVIMFVPVEPAFMLALAGDESLLQQAWEKGLLLVSPSTLLFALRTVANLWRQEQQKRNVEEISRCGAELYTKLAGFVDSLGEVGDRLAQAQKSYEAASSKLTTGRGNLIWQAEKLKALGIKSIKQLPRGVVEQAGPEMVEIDSGPGDD